jgi:hypothetical protein
MTSKRIIAYKDNPAYTWNFYCAVELRLTTGRVPASRSPMYQRIEADHQANCALHELCAAAKESSMSTVALAVVLTGTGWGTRIH